MSVRVAISGAAPESDNLGVRALLFSTLGALSRAMDVEPLVFSFDNASARRDFVLPGRTLNGRVRGAVLTRRFYSGSCLQTATTLASINPRLHPLSRDIASCAAVLDVTGGDSFTDLYGQRRFDAGCYRKRLALACGVPLIFLPQTYGPFNDERNRARAAELVRAAAACWARDERSYGILQDLLGDRFDPERHRSGVDLAFGLEPRDARDALSENIRSLVESTGTLVGFNVSGLIHNDPEKAVSQYGFTADYRRVVRDFLTRVLERSDASVLLIPHVVCPPGHYESDPDACAKVASELGAHADRVHVAPDTLDQSQVKWLIAQTGWFCGTRMHSTIAGLSSGVPTATVSYSDKAKGVFETCGQGEQVIDPRALETDEVIERLWASFESRNKAAISLAEHLPSVRARVDEQAQGIVNVIKQRAGACCGAVAG